MTMPPHERVIAALNHAATDHTPRFEIWLDGMFDALGVSDPQQAAVKLGQDAIMMPTVTPADSLAWQTGVDEFGRVWQDGMYTDGVVDTTDDLHKYSPPPEYAIDFFDAAQIKAVQAQHPDHCHIYGTHNGPFTAAYMAMGFSRFFMRLYDDPQFIHRILADRTAYCIATYQQAIALGAEVIVLGDDVAYGSGPMIAPEQWRAMMLPYHRQIVDALDVPVIWHSDGNILPLLPMAIEAGFVGVHGLEPNVGIDLAAVKHEFGRDLVIVGNLDVGVLVADDLTAVRAEVDRCLAEGGTEGYMLASCNSIFNGMNPAAVAEYFRYAGETV